MTARALLPCPDCGTQVSASAPTCPRCGRPLAGVLPPKKGLGTGWIVLIVVAVLLVPTLGIVSVLGVYGVRKYVANAKTAEAKNTLGQIGKDAVTAYESEAIGGSLGTSGGGAVVHRLCPSASAPVPANRSAIRGRKYQSSSADWRADETRDAGFSCMRFEMTAPQYFQYEYTATATTFTARAFGDLNGDGVYSTFEITGKVVDGALRVSPSISETNPEE